MQRMSSESEETSVSATQRPADRACLQAEGAALDEDEQADGDQDHGQQDVAPPAEELGDDRAGGDEPACGAPDADQDQEDHAVHDRAAGADVGEDGYVDTDVVAAVGKSGGGDLDDRRAALSGFGLLAVVTELAVLPSFPGVPQAEGDREQA